MDKKISFRFCNASLHTGLVTSPTVVTVFVDFRKIAGLGWNETSFGDLEIVYTDQRK